MGPPARRDEHWFTGVYQAEYGHVVKYGQRRLADMEAAAELAQEVFVIAWRRRREVPDRSLPWLYGVARRLLANQWRARRAAPDVLPMTDAGLLREPVMSGADATVGIADLQAALSTLADLDQEILRLVGWEELTVSEAAQVLGCTRTTAAVRLHRARRRLNHAMSKRAEPPAQQPVLATSRKVM
ncbi:RNA polymerase sigma-70 factor, ECF subfamily [Micromonospora viridifaciens]|uniref:RNA polymerase sigma-70 factor, ECF subfamily n=1 Tax=Micromonospora viridifaciens TaxID=1881 RepID=A0A1C4URB3_MICVI|nr:sigma-70 family RNA polymerase sigma factor [Micromonospora viridifaciens]SCE74269.1 RNA polymerase sigma-70 factor, ECF subfamily [Micromonospora viridifaciens]